MLLALEHQDGGLVGIHTSSVDAEAARVALAEGAVFVGPLWVHKELILSGA
jgi:hypothetical protein